MIEKIKLRQKREEMCRSTMYNNKCIDKTKHIIDNDRHNNKTRTNARNFQCNEKPKFYIKAQLVAKVKHDLGVKTRDAKLYLIT